MIFRYDKFRRRERPKTFLAQPDKTVIGGFIAKELVTDLCFNNLSELSCKVYKYFNGVLNPNYDNIEQWRLIEVENVAWFQIVSVKNNGKGKLEYKEIQGFSLENELTSIPLTSFGSMGDKSDESGGLDRYCIYNQEDTAHSILHIVRQKAPNWNIGHVDDDIARVYRAFTQDSIDAYSFLTGDVSTEYECIFQFNSFTRTISVFKLTNLTKTTSIYLSYENLIKEINIEYKIDDIYTVMHVVGGDDQGTPLTISEVNPAGGNYISNFSYYKSWMSKELQQRLTQYETDYNSLIGQYTNQLETLSQLYAELENLENKVPDSITISINDNIGDSTDLITKYRTCKSTREALGTSIIGNVDMNNRPIIINEDWSYSTIKGSYQEYFIGMGTTGYYIILHYTPILLTGSFFEDEPLWNYLDSVVNNAIQTIGIDKNNRTLLADSIFNQDKTINEGKNIIFKIDTSYLGNVITNQNLNLSFEVAENYDISLHNSQSTLYEEEAEYLIRITKLANKNNMSISSYISAIDYLNNNGRNTNWDDYGIIALQTQYDYYTNRMSLYLSDTSNSAYLENKNYRDSIAAILKTKQADYDSKLLQIETQKQVRDGYTLSLEQYLGEVLYKELSCYTRYTEFIDETFITTDVMTNEEILTMKKELYDMAQTKLKAICLPSYSMTISTLNFTTIPEFECYNNQLESGCVVTVNKDGILLESRLLKMHINWDNATDFELTFSSKYRLDEMYTALAEIQAQASAAATAQSFNGTGWNLAKNTVTPVKQYMSSALKASLQKLQNGEDIEVEMNQTGLIIRKYLENENDYSNNQLWITHGQIALTDDKWNSVKMAIGELTIGSETYYGVCAPVIIGKMLISEKLSIENADSSIILDENGAKFVNCGITINTGTNSVLLNSVDGITLSKETVKVFYADTEGNLHLTGTLDACDGNFSGKLVAATGTFSGTVTASEYVGGNIQSLNYYNRDNLGKLILVNNKPTKTGLGAYFNLTDGSLELNGQSTYGWMTDTQTSHQGRVYVEGGRIKITAFDNGIENVGKSIFLSNEGISTSVDANTSVDGEIAVNVIDIRSNIYEYLNPINNKTQYSNGLTLQTFGSPCALRSVKGRVFINPSAAQGVYDSTQQGKSNKFSFALNPRYLDTNGVIDYSTPTDNTYVVNSKGDGLFLFGRAESQSDGSMGNIVGLQFSANEEDRYIKAKAGSGYDDADLADFYCKNLYAENVSGGGGGESAFIGSSVDVVNQTILMKCADGTNIEYTVTENTEGIITITDDMGHSFQILSV